MTNLEGAMPTDLPEKPKRGRVGVMTSLRLAVLDFKFRLLTWRIEQALECHDHIKLLHFTESWIGLHQRTATRLRGESPFVLDRNIHIFFERVRKIVPKIAREERRLHWISGRMQRARLIQDKRALDRSQLIVQAAHQRLISLWTQI